MNAGHWHLGPRRAAPASLRLLRVRLPGRTTRRPYNLAPRLRADLPEPAVTQTVPTSPLPAPASAHAPGTTPPLGTGTQRLLADLLRVLTVHEDCNVDGDCTGCLAANMHRPYPCPVRVHLERVIGVMATRLGLTRF